MNYKPSLNPSDYFGITIRHKCSYCVNNSAEINSYNSILYGFIVECPWCRRSTGIPFATLLLKTFLSHPIPEDKSQSVSPEHYVDKDIILYPTATHAMQHQADHSTSHEHDWEKYVGLTESYQFCTICDDKTGV